MHVYKLSYKTVLVYLCTTAACNNQNISNNAKKETVQAVKLALEKFENFEEVSMDHQLKHINIMTDVIPLALADENIDLFYKAFFEGYYLYNLNTVSEYRSYKLDELNDSSIKTNMHPMIYEFLLLMVLYALKASIDVNSGTEMFKKHFEQKLEDISKNPVDTQELKELLIDKNDSGDHYTLSKILSYLYKCLCCRT